MPVIQAVIRAQVIEALQGTTEAAKLLLRMVQAFDLQECRHFERFAKSLIDQKLKGEERIRRMGADPSPDQLATIPLPHPDHIDVDPMTGSVAIKGPLDEAERLAQQKIYEARELDRLTLAEFDAWLGKKMPRKDRAALQKSRKELLERIALLTTELGEDDEDAV